MSTWREEFARCGASLCAKRTHATVLRAPLAVSALSLLAACGGSTGREPLPSTPTEQVDATVPITDDGGAFDVLVPYVDRVLPDAVPWMPPDSGGGIPWPCPPDIVVPSDAGCDDGGDAGDAGCTQSIAAMYDSKGNVVPAAPWDGGAGGSLCGICAPYTGGAGCTPTEQLIVLHDPSGRCYNCAASAGFLDDAIFPDFGNECADFTTNSEVTAAQASAYCLATLACILGPVPNGPSCAIGGQPTVCYCGAENPPHVCGMLTTTPDGVCAQVEIAGLGIMTLLPTPPVLKAYENTKLGSAQANEIMLNMASNSCNSCFDGPDAN